MTPKINRALVTFLLLSPATEIFGRQRWLERDGKPVFLHPRRFGYEQPLVLEQIRDACPGNICGPLARRAAVPLLATQPECSQQDMSDDIIDTSKQFGAIIQTNMTALALEYRQVEKNTPPDFTTEPPLLRNSVFCHKPPKHVELVGLVQAQDPDNDPNLFFDPASGSTVRKGSQPNTLPPRDAPPLSGPHSVERIPDKLILAVDQAPLTSCITAITIVLSGANPAATAPGAVTIVVGGKASTTGSFLPSATANTTPGVSGIGDFGSCSIPQIRFGTGFDGRKETSFEPTDKVSYNHGSSQTIDTITRFMCDQLTNTCDADQTAKNTCATAAAAANSASANTGAQADAFNGVFGIVTDFKSVAVVDDQGRIVGGINSSSAVSSAASGPNTFVASRSVTVASLAPTAAPGADFGSCSVPEIEFGVGFDGRRATSFQPVDRTSFNQGSSPNIDDICRSICADLRSSCGANQIAQDECSQAEAAAATAPAGTGRQADAFNAIFGFRTNFAIVAQVDDQGVVIQQNNPLPTRTQPAPPASPSITPPSTPIPPDTAQPQGSGNLQPFSGNLGGIAAPAVSSVGDGKFETGGDSFNDLKSAISRSCDDQKNDCADAANAAGNNGDLTVANCTAQRNRCIAG